MQSINPVLQQKLQVHSDNIRESNSNQSANLTTTTQKNFNVPEHSRNEFAEQLPQRSGSSTFNKKLESERQTPLVIINNH